MSKSAWQAFLGLQIGGIVLGLGSALLPPYEGMQRHFAIFLNGVLLGHMAVGALLLLLVLAGIVAYIHAMLRKKYFEGQLFRFRREALTTAVTLVTASLSLVSVWFLIVGVVWNLFAIPLTLVGYTRVRNATIQKQ